MPQQEAPSPGGYRVFTRRFDREVEARKLGEVFGPLSLASQRNLESVYEAYQTGLRGWKVTSTMQGMSAIEAVRQACAVESLKDSALTILIDQSGSMRGQKMLMAAAAADVMTDLILSLGMTVEVLGHTTTTWKGGKSRQEWMRAGKPANPGRLCDLLHIVYRSAKSKRRDASSEEMFREGLLKENIDGEAIEWAVERSVRTGKTNRFLIVISDGASVDDSTLSANEDGHMLENHILEVVADLSQTRKVVLAAIGIDYEVKRYYPNSLRVQSPSQLGVELPAFVAKTIIDHFSHG